jgi:hypothetical protein
MPEMSGKNLCRAWVRTQDEIRTEFRRVTASQTAVQKVH